MSDYLTNVVARSFAREPAIRPRLVSLYEPSRLGLPLLENEIEWERSPMPPERDDVRAEVADSSPPQSSLQQPTQARVSPEPIMPVRSKESTPLDNVSPEVDSPASRETPQRAVQTSAALQRKDHQATPAQQTRVVAEVVEGVSERQEVVARRPLPTTPSAPAKQAASITTPPITANVQDRSAPPPPAPLVQVEHSPSSPQLDRSNSAPPSNAVARGRLLLDLEIEDQSGTTTPHSPERPNQTYLVRKVERQLETTNVAPRLSPSPTITPVSPANVVHPISVAPARRANETENTERVTATEPTIQVTIGRVEVRSVVADEGRKGQRPKQSRLMSLDDYLRQRAQGAKP